MPTISGTQSHVVGVTVLLLEVAARLAFSSVPVGQITAARIVVQCRQWLRLLAKWAFVSRGV